jgi:hypothetical protein
MLNLPFCATGKQGKLAFAGAFFVCFAASELNYIFTNNVHVHLNCI